MGEVQNACSASQQDTGNPKISEENLWVHERKTPLAASFLMLTNSQTENSGREEAGYEGCTKKTPSGRENLAEADCLIPV
jgi:hypothetical protein